VHGLAGASGGRVDNLGGFVFELRQDRVARVVSYSDPETARVAAMK